MLTEEKTPAAVYQRHITPQRLTVTQAARGKIADLVRVQSTGDSQTSP